MRIRINKSEGDVNILQSQVMKIVDSWVREKKTPIPHRFILNELKSQGVLEVTAKAAIRVLVNKGYIRKAIILSNRAFYVQLRSI